MEEKDLELIETTEGVNEVVETEDSELGVGGTVAAVGIAVCAAYGLYKLGTKAWDGAKALKNGFKEKMAEKKSLREDDLFEDDFDDKVTVE
jgi:hypothetical protein